jgi:hypothetical protein
MGLLGFEHYDDLKAAHYKWVQSAIKTDNSDKENKWTQGPLTACRNSVTACKWNCY